MTCTPPCPEDMCDCFPDGQLHPEVYRIVPYPHYVTCTCAESSEFGTRGHVCDPGF